MTGRIYLISEDGYAFGNTEEGAKALEAVGYHRCSRKEYQRQMKKVATKDEQEAMAFVEKL